MILVDTSVWVELFRDKKGRFVQAFRERIAGEIYVLCRFTQMELLQGARDEGEWRKLDEYLSSQYYLECSEETWKLAARIFYELRRKGITVNSPVDCCIAQIALESGAVLLHRDRDFEKIAVIRAVSTEWF